jgi:hypothetical protein
VSDTKSTKSTSIEFSAPIDNVDRLMTQVDRLAALYRESDRAGLLAVPPPLAPLNHPPAAPAEPVEPAPQVIVHEAPRAHLGVDLTDPPAPVSADGVVDLSALCGFSGDRFLRLAYRAILGREPDQAGFASYLGSLKAGTRSRIEICCDLHWSAEGQAAQRNIPGLQGRRFVLRMGKVPVIGSLLQALVNIAGLTKARRSTEAAQHRLDERIAAIERHLGGNP